MGCCLGVLQGVEYPCLVLKRMGCYPGVECPRLRQVQQVLPERPVRPTRHLLAWNLLPQEPALQERLARLFQRLGQRVPQPFLLLA